jgi:hypothetical protein
MTISKTALPIADLSIHVSELFVPAIFRLLRPVQQRHAE